MAFLGFILTSSTTLLNCSTHSCFSSIPSRCGVPCSHRTVVCILLLDASPSVCLHWKTQFWVWAHLIKWSWPYCHGDPTISPFRLFPLARSFLIHGMAGHAAFPSLCWTFPLQHSERTEVGDKNWCEKQKVQHSAFASAENRCVIFPIAVHGASWFNLSNKEVISMGAVGSDFSLPLCMAEIPCPALNKLGIKSTTASHSPARAHQHGSQQLSPHRGGSYFFLNSTQLRNQHLPWIPREQ